MVPLDIIFILSYFIIVVGIGYYTSRKETTEGYLLAGRNLSSFKSASSIVASNVGGGLVVAGIAYVYTYGISAFTYFLGGVFGYLVFYFFAMSLKKEADKHKFYTVSDYLKYRYGERGTIWFSLMLFLVNVSSFAMQAITGGKIIEKLTGISFTISVIIMLSITLTYLVMGGFKAVVFTDVFQCGVLLILFLAIVSIFSNNISSLSSIVFNETSPWLMVAFFITGIVIPFSANDLWQRIYATKDLKSVKRSLTISIAVGIVIGTLITFLGVAIKYLLPAVDADVALLEGFLKFLPPGMLGLGIVALMAVIMSSADTIMFNCSSIFIQDILRVKQRFKEYYAKAFILTAVGGVVIAILFKNMVKLLIMNGIILMMLGFLIILTWAFKLKKEYMPNTYFILAVCSVLILLIFGIREELLVSGLVLVPFSYFLSGTINKIKKIKNKRKS